MVVNLERVKIPVRTLLPANRAEGEGQVTANSNVQLVGDCAVAHHSVGISRVTNRVGNGEVVSAVCVIGNANRDVISHVDNRIHAIVARKGLTRGVNGYLISIDVPYGKVERTAVDNVGCSRHKAVRIVYTGNVVGNIVTVNMLLITKRNLLALGQEGRNTAVCRNRVVDTATA